MRQQLRELSVTSRHSSITQAIPRSSPSTALSPSAAGPHRLQLSPGVMQTLTDQRSPLRAAGAAGTPNSWAGSSPAVQSSSPSKVWGESTPPLHPSSPKGGLSVLRKLRWGKAPGQGSLLVPQVSSASGNANRGLLDSSVQGQAAVHFSETSRSAFAWKLQQELLYKLYIALVCKQADYCNECQTQTAVSRLTRA